MFVWDNVSSVVLPMSRQAKVQNEWRKIDKEGPTVSCALKETQVGMKRSPNSSAVMDGTDMSVA
jgi:hypothetical protein